MKKEDVDSIVSQYPCPKCEVPAGTYCTSEKVPSVTEHVHVHRFSLALHNGWVSVDDRAAIGKNVAEPVIHVRHADLDRTGESVFRSKCPKCRRGVLLVRRHEETFEIIAEDNCIFCGQRFVYEDIERLRGCP